MTINKLHNEKDETMKANTSSIVDNNNATTLCCKHSCAALNPSALRNSNKNSDELPPLSLDQQIKEAFEACRSRGTILRTDPLSPSVKSHALPGELGLVIKYQPNLLSKKRATSLPPQVPMSQPFNPNKFHFNHVSEAEVLLRVPSGMDGQEQPEPKEQHHMIVANVSPLMNGHALLLPWPKRCLPQRLTSEAVDLVLQLMMQDVMDSNNRRHHFRMGFNSLGAFSSVNHLHIHFLYPGDIPSDQTDLVQQNGHSQRQRNHVEGAFPIERAPVLRTLSHADQTCQVDMLDWMVPCFSFHIPSSPSKDDDHERGAHTVAAALRNEVVRFLAILYQREIPHNVLFIPGLGGNQEGCSPRVIVIPRKPQHFFPSAQAGFNAALGEISGYLIAKSLERYEEIVEEEVVRVMETSVACSTDELDCLAKELQQDNP